MKSSVLPFAGGLKALVSLCAMLALGSSFTSLASPDYTQLEPKPDRNTINKGLSSPSSSFMISKLGIPGGSTRNCNYTANAELKKHLVTNNVGPFRATGLKPAIESIRRVFLQVKKEKPDLYKQLSSDGMFCVRTTRGLYDFSNHSWGIAIDIKISGKRDGYGDDLTMVGLSLLAPYFAEEKFYWGAGFKRKEDSMHFEASKELIEEWVASGELKTEAPPSPGGVMNLLKPALRDLKPTLRELEPTLRQLWAD